MLDTNKTQKEKRGKRQKGRMSEAKASEKDFSLFYIFFDINFPFSRLRKTFSPGAISTLM
jgi:hypothetical protein